MKKCIFKVHKLNRVEIRGGVIRIDNETAEILSQVQVETGLSIKSIASTFIKCAAEDYEIEEVE